MASELRHRNHIFILKKEIDWVKDDEELCDMAVGYFANLFKKSHPLDFSSCLEVISHCVSNSLEPSKPQARMGFRVDFFKNSGLSSVPTFVKQLKGFLLPIFFSKNQSNFYCFNPKGRSLVKYLSILAYQSLQLYLQNWGQVLSKQDEANYEFHYLAEPIGFCTMNANSRLVSLWLMRLFIS